MAVVLNNRNIRVLISAIVIFLIVGFFVSSQVNFTPSLQVAKTAQSGDTIPFSGEHDEEKDNTLAGSSHSSPNPPYAQGESGSGAGVGAGAGSGSGSAAKPKVIADKSSSESESKKNKDKQAAAAADKASSSNTNSNANGVSKSCKKRDYVVMIDAGSTGSRVHVYEFNTCFSPPKLVNEAFEMLKPGLSSFDTDTKGAAASLDPLLELALKTVPKDKQSCTPVAVKATAGLRLLGEEKSSKILAEVRSHLEKDYPFAVVPGDGISIMDGLSEGVYAWITTNYLLGNIGSSEKLPTAAVFDLGGGSTQIVFEPEFPPNEEMVDGEHKYEITFGGRLFVLYQFSHLGYGLMEGRNKVHSFVLQSSLKNGADLSKVKFSDKKSAKEFKSSSVTINNPCIQPGVTVPDVIVELSKEEVYVVNMKGPSTNGDFTGAAQCRAIGESILKKDADCTSKPCSFNGVHQPSLTRAFKKTSDMYVFSYFYDRTNPIGLPSSFSVEEVSQLAKVVCQGDSLWKEILLDDHIKELKDEPQWCLDLSFITAMLHTGYDIPFHRELKTAKTIDNNELGWCLGASLPLLDKKESGWTCRVKEA